MSFIKSEAEEIAKRGKVANDLPYSCYYCHKPLTHPRIEWVSKTNLYLHPVCARDLCIRLLRDVWEYECKQA